MNVYFYIAVSAALLSLAGIILLLHYMVKLDSTAANTDNDYTKQTHVFTSNNTGAQAGVNNPIQANTISFTDHMTGIRTVLTLNGMLHIGRGYDNDLVVPDTSVCEKHCRLIADGALIYAEDMNTPNGTFVNGNRITHTQLKPGDTIAFGNRVFTIAF